MTTNQVHGHEIMSLVAKYPEGIEVATLSDIVEHEFGSGTRFFTCSAEGMTLQELMTILVERGKFQLRDNRLFPGDAPACNHD
ncbi:MAG: YecH family metal-binding protein [Verrucomicrobiae bacterium]